MPLYEYKCQGCGDVFEVIQKFSDQPLTVHEKCGGKVERLVSAAALRFKGSGWYVTDYGKGKTHESGQKSEGSNGSGKSEKSNGSGKSSESAGKSESSSKTESSSTSSTPSASKSDIKK